MMSSRYFHFTIGPVQGFVAQARRTKDFWAGSFLLSYLSAVAMIATQKQGGKIIFPLPDESFLHALTTPDSKGARQGNIPNRFKAEVPAGFSADTVIQSVQSVWEALAQLIWENDLNDYNDTPTRQIWDRQVKHFWEISWALSDDPSESDILDRRKNWRTHIHTDEPGQKCAIMATYQELSGIDVAQSKKQREFWKNLRKSKKNFDLDIGENERLSAIAFIKRRFVRYFGEFHTTLTATETDIYGWKLSPNVPSVALVAAAPWLAKVCEHPNITELISAAKALRALEMPLSELNMLKNCETDIRKIDGMVLFDTLLENRNIFPDKTAAQRVIRALQPLYKDDRPSPFYAVLMMDGDNLGKQMSDPGKQKTISTALQQFTQKVPEITNRHSGFLIYAGGDDVLAILPLETAMQCAADIRHTYDTIFKKSGESVKTSISAAIVYAHIKNPLHSVLHHIHKLLDDVAKEKTGRDAVAVEIIKPGGVQIQWSKKWKEALTDNKMVLEELAQNYRKQTEQNQYSSGFFYRIREIMELLEGIGTITEKEALLAVEYRNGTRISQNEALEVIRPLLKQCKEGNHISADAALLVRFLAQKGVEL